MLHNVFATLLFAMLLLFDYITYFKEIRRSTNHVNAVYQTYVSTSARTHKRTP